MECMRERLEEVIPGHLPLVVVYNCGMDYGAMEMECMRERLEEVIPGHLQLVVVYSCGMDYGTMEMECMRERLEEVRGEAGRGVGAETDPHSTPHFKLFVVAVANRYGQRMGPW